MMSTAVNEKLINKIMKLKNLAENNPNENEAQEALLKMQALMAEHSIEMSAIEEVKPAEKVVTSDRATDYSKLSWYMKDLARIIADNFRCHWWYHSINGKSSIVFFGLKEDIEVAKTVYKYALTALEYNANQFIEKERQERFIRNSKPLKATYIKGFLSGLRDKFKEQVDTKGWGLVLVKDALVEQKFSEIKLRNVRRKDVQTAGDMEAFASGYEKGKSFTAASGEIEGK